MNHSRRKFITKSVVGAAAITSIPAIVSSCISAESENSNTKISLFEKGDTILFQGDSITDAHREKKNELPNNPHSFGLGYAFLAASSLLNSLPEKELTIYNRGISGNKVYQLADRWQKDCLDLKPNVLSILIGVNDYWHKRKNGYEGTIEIYENDFDALLQKTKDSFPELKLIICEPFLLANTSVIDNSWLAPFKEYQDAAKRISDKFETIWVPFQKVFNEAVKHAPATYWTADGVHPAMPGAQLMAEAWLRTVK